MGSEGIGCGHVYLSDSSETELGSEMSVEVQKMVPSHDGGKKLETHMYSHVSETSEEMCIQN